MSQDMDKAWDLAQSLIKQHEAEISSLRTRMMDMQTTFAAQLAAAQKDAARLDWLDAWQVSLYTVSHSERRALTSTIARWEDICVFDGWSVGSRTDELATVREAIDAAMEGK